MKYLFGVLIVLMVLQTACGKKDDEETAAIRINLQSVNP